MVRPLARTARSRDPLQRARTLAGQLGGQWVDPWSLGERILSESEERGLALEHVARDVVSELLWVRAVAGDEGARDRLLGLWHSLVHGWCRGVCGRRLDPDDLAQEVLLRALRRLEQIHRPARFGAWLRGTLYRGVQERERWARVGRFVPEALAGDRPSPLPLADAALVAGERQARVRLALDSLSAEHRVLLWAHYVEGQRRRDICAWSGLAEGTLNRRLTRARAAFERACRRLGVAP